jgi:leucyl-tRNA synthetase
MQRSWIGRSSGHLVTFKLVHSVDSGSRTFPLSPLDIFTTRVETIYGVIAYIWPRIRCNFR